MKIPILCALFAATVLLCGCSSTKFTAYQGTDVIQGKGGAVRSVDGLDFWYDGDPDRKYKILGVLEDSSGHRIPLGPLSRFSKVFSESSDKDSAIAQAARKRGADAVVAVSGDQGASNQDDDGERHHRRHAKLAIVKYVE